MILARGLGVVLLLAFAPGRASGQTCSHFLNASDGDDGNPGSQTAPVRSLEHAYTTFPSGSVVCVAAGEYFYGSDADGIQLTSADKNMRFRLESFAGSSEIRFSETEFSVDSGTGTVTFEAGSSSALVFGSGVVNLDNPDRPNLLNFLHTVRLASGSLIFQGLTPVMEPSVGNLDFRHPTNPAKLPPATAGIRWGNGNVTGGVTFQNAPRNTVFEGSDGLGHTFLLPPMTSGSSLVFQQNGPVDINTPLDLDGVDLRFAHSGSVTFSQPVSARISGTVLEFLPGFTGSVRFAATATVDGSGQQTWIDLPTTGTVRFDDLNLASTGSARTTFRNRGGGTIQVLESTSNADIQTASGHFADIVNLDGTAELGTTQRSWSLRGSITNAGNLRFASGAALSDVVETTVLTNTGTILSTTPVTIAGTGLVVLNEGDASGVDSWQFTGSTTIRGAGAWGHLTASGATVRFEGSPSLQTLTLNAATALVAADAAPSVSERVELGSGSALSLLPGSELSVTDVIFSASDAAADLPEGAVLSFSGVLDASPATQPFRTTGGLIFVPAGQNATILVGLGATVPAIRAVGATAVLQGGSTWMGFDLEDATVNASVTQDARVQAIKLSDAATLSLASQQTLLLAGMTQIDATSGLTLDSPAPVLLETDLSSEGGSVSFPASGVRISGSTTLDAPAEHGLVLPSLLMDSAGTASLTVNGTVASLSSVDITQGNIFITQAGRLHIGGNLSRSEGYFALESTGILLLDGTGPQIVSGFSDSVLPSLITAGTDVRFDGNITVVGGLRVAGGTTTLTDGSTALLQNDLSVVGGTLHLPGMASITVGTNLNVSSGLLRMESGTLRIQENAILAGGRIEAGASIWHFPSSDASVFLVETPTSLSSLLLGDNASVSKEGAASLSIRNALTLNPGSVLTIGNGDINVFRGSASPTVSNNGTLASRSGSLVLRSETNGNTPTLAGTGRYGNVIVEMESDAHFASLVPGTASLRLGGTLTFLNGGIELNGAAVVFESEGGLLPGLVYSLEDERPANGTVDARGFRSSVGQLVFNTAGSAFDLTYTGSVTSLYTPPAHVAASAVRDLRVLTTDPINTPAIFGVSLANPMTASGHFQLTDGAVLRLQQPLRLSGEIRRHSVSGRISGPAALILAGQLNDFRLLGESSNLDLLRLEGQDTFGQSSLWLEGTVGAIESTSGRYRFRPSENTEITGSRVLQRVSSSNSDWTIETDLSVGSPGSPNQVTIDGTLTFAAAGNLILPQGGTVSATPTSVINVNAVPGGRTGDGFLVVNGSALMSIPTRLPRLRIDIDSVASDDVFLQSDLIIGEHLVLTNGDLRLGGHEVELAGGNHWFDDDGQPVDGTSDGIQGEVAQQPGSILISDAAQLHLGGILEIQDATVRVAAGNGSTVSINSMSPQGQVVSQVGGGLRLASGILDLGNSDWQLAASAADMLIASGGSVQSTSPGSFVEALQTLEDDHFGELVLVGSGNAGMVLDSAISISALRVEGTVRVASTGALTLTDRLVFGQRGASLLTPSVGTLLLEDGARVIRRGLGSLSHSPTVAGSLDLAYQLGDGSLTGLDTGFISGTLTAGLEVPTTSPVAELLVVAGAGTDGAHSVSISSGLRIMERVNLISGTLRFVSAPPVLAPQATIFWSSPDARAASALVLGNTLVAEGPYNVIVQQGITRIDLPAALMSSTGSLTGLTLESANGNDTMIESIRLLGSFAADTVSVGAMGDPVRVNLTGNTLTARHHLGVHSGTVTSTQLASLKAEKEAVFAAGTDVAGNIQTTVSGHLDLAGRVSGLVLDLEGDARISGSLGTTTRLTFSGTDQTTTIPAALTVGTVEARQSGLPGTIRIRTDSGSPYDLRVNGALDLQGGILDLAGGALTLAETAAVTRGSGMVIPSYVQGPIKRPASEGSTREIIFPLGHNGTYLPVSLTFSQPLLSATTLELNMVEPALISAVGLPIVDQEAVIQSVRTPQWTLTSTVDYAQAQPYSVSVTLPVDTGLGSTPVRLLRQTIGRADLGWILVPGTQLTAVTQEGVIARAFDSRGGLSPRGVHLGLGLPAASSDARVHLQWADFRPTSGAQVRTMTANGVPLLTLPAGQSASPLIPLFRTQDPLPIAFSASSVALGPQNAQLALQDGEAGWLILRDGPDGLPGLQAVAALRAGSVPSGSTDFVLVNALGEDLTLQDQLGQTTLASASSGGSATGRVPASTLYANLLGQDETSRNVFRLALEPFDGATSVWMALNGPSGAEMRLLGADGGILTPQITTDTEEASVAVPEMIAWRGNYPNPFAASTRLVVDLASGADVTMEVFDLLGRRVRHESARWLAAGTQELAIDADGLGSGVYLVRITARSGADQRVATGRITLRR